MAFTEVSVTMYECPLCHHRYATQEEAEKCYHNKTVIDDLVGNFDAKTPMWYRLQQKDTIKNEETLVIPWRIANVQSDLWRNNKSCLDRTWKIYNLNAPNAYTGDYFDVVGTMSLQEAFKLNILPNMQHIFKLSRADANITMKKKLAEFWEEYIVSMVREAVRKRTLEDLYKCTVSGILQKYWTKVGQDYPDDVEDAIAELVNRKFIILG